MKFETKVITVPKNVDVGDLIICENGKYLLIKSPDKDFPYRFINIETADDVNGYMSLSSVNIAVNRYGVFTGSGKTIRIVKANKLKLVEVE